MNIIIMSIAAMFATLFGGQPKENFKSLTINEFSTFIAQPNVQLVDVRTPAEYAEGHIANSSNIDVMSQDFSQVADSTLVKDQPVALYCRSGKRSKHAAEILSSKGYHVVELDNGFIGWASDGKPIVK